MKELNRSNINISRNKKLSVMGLVFSYNTDLYFQLKKFPQGMFTWSKTFEGSRKVIIKHLKIFLGRNKIF